MKKNTEIVDESKYHENVEKTLEKERKDFEKHTSVEFIGSEKRIGDDTRGQVEMRNFMESKIEPIISNRFIVNFPEKYGIPPHAVKSVLIPTIYKNKCDESLYSSMA